MTLPKSSVELLSHSNGIFVELLHHADDPCVWIIRESKKFLWFRRNVSDVWFFTKEQALTSVHRHSAEHPS
ncbi:MAG: hypothetical protein KA247_04445 [Bacteroidetes bacterium]|nr:hypothetical protein [Bacteroidota bacterium]